MKWIVSALVVLATATAWAQQPKRFTLTANTQCASVSAQNNSTVGIIVSGTWSGTLTPNLRIAGVSGAPTASTTVTPSNSTTSQGTITGNGGFKSSVGGFTQFNLCFTSFSSGSAIIDLLPTTALNAGLLGGGSPAGSVTGTGLTSGNVISGAGGSAIQDSTIPAAQVVTANSPGVGLCHFAGSTQVCTSSTVVNADIAASTIDLTTKVTGALPLANQANRILSNQYSNTPVTGTASAVTIFTYSLPGNTLGAGGCIRINTMFVHSTGSASIQFQLTFGASTMSSVASATTGANGAYYEYTVCNKPGVTNAQVAGGKGAYASTAISMNQGATSTTDTTSAVTINWTFNVAATDAITPGFFLVERL